MQARGNEKGCAKSAQENAFTDNGGSLKCHSLVFSVQSLKVSSFDAQLLPDADSNVSMSNDLS